MCEVSHRTRDSFESRGGIAYAAAFIEWLGEEGKRLYGDTILAQASDKRTVVTKEPIGVCAAIAPWNFPAAMIIRNAGQTCVCGNRILVQDSVYSASTKRLAETAGVMKVADGLEPGAPALSGSRTGGGFAPPTKAIQDPRRHVIRLSRA